MRQDIVSRSSYGCNEQIPFDNRCGNIGTTRSVKYTLVPRSKASLSMAEFSVT